MKTIFLALGGIAIISILIGLSEIEHAYAPAPPIPTNNNYTLAIDNHNYTIGYGFEYGGRAGTVESITANTTSKTISVIISSYQTNQTGSFAIALPRAIIDSNDSAKLFGCGYMVNNTSHTKSGYNCNYDSDYKISLTQYNDKGEPVNTTAIQAWVNVHDLSDRKIMMNYPAGKVRIDIQGTYMVPEFGSSSLMFGVSIIAGIAIVSALGRCRVLPR